MTCYNLRIEKDGKVLSDVATNRDEALVRFGEELNLHLTLKDTGGAAPYLLDEWNEGPHWVKPQIPVFAK